MDSPERLADRSQSINISETQCYDGEGNFLGAFGTEIFLTLCRWLQQDPLHYCYEDDADA